jgi:hypothetical protein
MRAYRLESLSDAELLRALSKVVADERSATATVLAHIGEVESRRLYAPAGYSSMFAYCVEELHLSEFAALKRIRAARAARKFPEIYTALTEGRVHLSAVVLIGRRLTRNNVHELLAAATHKTKAEIELLLAQRFPRRDLPTTLRPLSAPEPSSQAALPSVEASQVPSDSRPANDAEQLAPGPVVLGRPNSSGSQSAPVQTPGDFTRMQPLAPERFGLQVTISKSTHDKLRLAQELLSHAVPSGDVATILDRALDALISQLEKRKHAATEKPRSVSKDSSNKRHVPAEVKRAVWKRDGAQCTFVNDAGQRCSARKFLEYDHIEPVARGGQATLDGIRLRCRAHNYYAAEQALGVGFMARKLKTQCREYMPEQVRRNVVVHGSGEGTCSTKVRRNYSSFAGFFGSSPRARRNCCAKRCASSSH